VSGDSITQLCVGGIFALLVIREVFAFISKRKNGITDERIGCQFNGISEFHDRLQRWIERDDLGEISRMVCDLHEWHNISDGSVATLAEISRVTKELHDWHNVKDRKTGAPIWYVNSTMVESFDKLSERFDKNNELLLELLVEIRKD